MSFISILIISMVILIKSSSSVLFMSPVNPFGSGKPITAPFPFPDLDQRYSLANNDLQQPSELSPSSQRPQSSSSLMSSPLSFRPIPRPLTTSLLRPSSKSASRNQHRVPGARRYKQPGRYTRRLDCTIFCQTTGFHGTIGGCNCGYQLFKRSSFNTIQRRKLDDAPDYGWDANQDYSQVTTPNPSETLSPKEAQQIENDDVLREWFN